MYLRPTHLLLCDVINFSVMSCTSLWCHVLLCDVMYFSVMSCTSLWCHPLLCDVMYFSVMSCTFLWCHVLFCDVIHFSVMSCTFLWCHVLFCDVIHFSVMSCTFLWCYLLFFVSVRLPLSSGQTSHSRGDIVPVLAARLVELGLIAACCAKHASSSLWMNTAHYRRCVWSKCTLAESATSSVDQPLQESSVQRFRAPPKNRLWHYWLFVWSTCWRLHNFRPHRRSARAGQATIMTPAARPLSTPEGPESAVCELIDLACRGLFWSVVVWSGL